MPEPLPDLAVASVDELRDYARKVTELMDTRPAVVAQLRDRLGRSWPEIEAITRWPSTSVRRWYEQHHSSGDKG